MSPTTNNLYINEDYYNKIALGLCRKHGEKLSNFIYIVQYDKSLRKIYCKLNVIFKILKQEFKPTVPDIRILLRVEKSVENWENLFKEVGAKRKRPQNFEEANNFPFKKLSKL